MKIDIEDFNDDDFGLDIEKSDDDLQSDFDATENYRPHIKTDIEYKHLLKNRKNRLTCIDFSEEKDELIFYFETVNYHFGKCLIVKEQNKVTNSCCICSNDIESGKDVYIPFAWDIKLKHFKICRGCYFSAYNRWIYD